MCDLLESRLIRDYVQYTVESNDLQKQKTDDSKENHRHCINRFIKHISE